MPDLRLTRVGRRITGWATVILLVGWAMAGTVWADDSEWGKSAIAYGIFGFFLFFLGTASFRLQLKNNGRVEAQSLLGVRTIDLRNGYKVRRSFWFGPAIGVLRVGRKRVRLNGLLGKPAKVDEWLAAAASAPSPAATPSRAG